MSIITKSYPRAALVGNPSDGYFGKTIAFVFSNFHVEVILNESDRLEIIPGQRDHLQFQSISDLYQDIQQFGYYGGIRLVKATIKKFYEYCADNSIHLQDKNFRIEYVSNIPNRLGLAGSSAIITACMKALMQFYSVEIAKPVMANIILAVETEELGIGAGLQDRVAQVYEEPVYMDFNKNLMNKQGYGLYEPIETEKLPPLYIAYRTDLSEGSEVTHNNLRERYSKGDAEVLAAIEQWSNLTETVKNKLLAGDKDIGHLLNKNFDIRKKVCVLDPNNLEMVNLARSVGASAKFTGSGGAVIGTYDDETMFNKLTELLKQQGIEVIKPEIVDS